MNIFIYYLPNISNHQFCLTLHMCHSSNMHIHRPPGSSVQPTPGSPRQPIPFGGCFPSKACSWMMPICSASCVIIAMGKRLRRCWLQHFFRNFPLRMGGHWEKHLFLEIFVGLIDLKGMISESVCDVGIGK